MAEDRRKEPLGIRARARELVRVAEPRGLHLHKNLARLRTLKLDIHDLKRLTRRNRNSGNRAHRLSLKYCRFALFLRAL